MTRASRFRSGGKCPGRHHGNAGVPPAWLGPGEVGQTTVECQALLRAGRPRSQGLLARPRVHRRGSNGSGPRRASRPPGSGRAKGADNCESPRLCAGGTPAVPGIASDCRFIGGFEWQRPATAVLRARAGGSLRRRERARFRRGSPRGESSSESLARPRRRRCARA